MLPGSTVGAASLAEAVGLEIQVGKNDLLLWLFGLASREGQTVAVQTCLLLLRHSEPASLGLGPTVYGWRGEGSGGGTDFCRGVHEVVPCWQGVLVSQLLGPGGGRSLSAPERKIPVGEHHSWRISAVIER